MAYKDIMTKEEVLNEWKNKRTIKERNSYVVWNWTQCLLMLFCIFNFIVSENKFAFGIMTILTISEVMEKYLYYKETKDKSVIKEVISLVIMALGLLLLTLGEYMGKQINKYNVC